MQLKDAPNDDVDMLAWMGRAALELIGQGGFGHSFDPLVKHEHNAYAEALKQFGCVVPDPLKPSSAYPFLLTSTAHYLPVYSHYS